MTFNIEKRTVKINEEIKENIYKLISYEDDCEKILDMFKKGLLELKPIKEVNDLILNYTDLKNEEISVFFTIYTYVDNGYYSLDENDDDEYVPFYEEEYSYYKINNCPICGEKFKINIINKGDISKEYENLCKKIDSYKGRLSNQKRNELSILQKELDKLLKSDLKLN